MYKALRGMKDVIPAESSAWQALEADARNVFERFGYAEIRTPVMEERALFVKSIGDGTDIVTKEMFSFRDRGERDIALRPEGTAPIVRAYLEANLHKTDAFQKLYYIGPFFRAERPQAGRMRQFHQIGAEAIGSASASIDAEIIVLMASILDAAGVSDYKIRLNNLGCHADKKRLSEKLKKTLSDKKAMLCDDCRARLMKNPIRVLDCKKESCRTNVRAALKSLDFLCEACTAHFSQVKQYLKATAAGAKCVDDRYIVRGLDYYTGTVFEVSHPALGAQDALGAGGRYDDLVKDMGGPALGAVGFALGVERLLMALKGGAQRYAAPLSVYVATLGEKTRIEGFKAANALREAGISCVIDHEDKSLKAEMRAADSLGARFVLIIGDEELSRGEAALRDMTTKEQSTVKLCDVADAVKKKLSR
jgi:histidyl-tRNA synthetase